MTIAEMLAKGKSAPVNTAPPAWAAAVPDSAVLQAIDYAKQNSMPVTGKNSTRQLVEGPPPADYTKIDGRGGVRKLTDGLYRVKYYGSLLLNMNDGRKFSVPSFILGDGSIYSIGADVPDGTPPLKEFNLSLEFDSNANRMVCRSITPA